VDYNFYDKAISETVFFSVVHTGNLELLSYLKETLFRYVPTITSNPYYTRDLILPDVSAELLLHPILEHDITQKSFDLFCQRTIYCWEYPKAIVYLELFTRLQRKLDISIQTKDFSDTLSNISRELSVICKQYEAEPFAHKQDAIDFYEHVAKLCSASDTEKALSDLIGDFCIAITLPPAQMIQ
jgi:hypothetical protein